MAEFTGERVIPGQVDADLWNEHFSRYAFAARLTDMKRVLDLGCGTGYGAAELSRKARHVTGVDISREALETGSAAAQSAQLSWVQASAVSLPFSSGAFDLVVAFEVIEHIEDWAAMLSEARRLLAPGGRFCVSTPNKTYYAESRKQSGPNPFHHREFEFHDFKDQLLRVFPFVSLFTQNHAEVIVFTPVGGGIGGEVQIESGEAPPDQAHFLVAVCGLSEETSASSFVFIPSSANILREREHHIQRLEAELAMKNGWLEEARKQHRQLVDLHREQTMQLERSNTWAAELNAKLQAAGARIVALQDEAASAQAAAVERISELEAENVATTQWAIETETRLTGELQRCIVALHEADKTVEERTHWALALDAEKSALEAKIGMAMASRWLRLGRVIGLGPELRNQ